MPADAVMPDCPVTEPDTATLLQEEIDRQRELAATAARLGMRRRARFHRGMASDRLAELTHLQAGVR